MGWFKREPKSNAAAAPKAPAAPRETVQAAAGASMAEQLVAAFGGADNIKNIAACITRLRIEVLDKNKVDKPALKRLGAAGVLEIGNNVQAIFGPRAEGLADDMQHAM